MLCHNKWHRENKMEINEYNQQIDIVIKLEPIDEDDIVENISKSKVDIIRQAADDGEIEVKEEPIDNEYLEISSNGEVDVKEEPIDQDDLETSYNNEIDLLPTKDGRVHCPICQKPIKSAYLQRHINYHSKIGSTTFTCNVCNESFPEKRKLIAHKDQCTGSFQIKCEHCKESFSTNDSEFHLCDLDENIPADNHNTVKQLRENNVLNTKLLKNKSTSETDNNQPKVKEVVKSKKKDGPYECTHCDRKFIYKSRLTSHMAKYALECPLKPKPLLKHLVKCEFCDLRFCDLDGLLNHSASHDAKLDFECTMCEITTCSHNEEQYMRKSRWQNSETNATNSRNRKFLCDVCGKTYTQSSHLWQHMRFHQGIKPFVCTEPNCNRKFTIRPDLNDHIRKCHTGERPYHCLICDKRFLTGSVFYQHRLIHRGERRYGCDQCTKRFYRADALKNHLRIHSGVRPYACTHCPKSFRQKGDCEKHMRARHTATKPVLKPSISKLKNMQIKLEGTDGPVRIKKESNH